MQETQVVPLWKSVPDHVIVDIYVRDAVGGALSRRERAVLADYKRQPWFPRVEPKLQGFVREAKHARYKTWRQDFSAQFGPLHVAGRDELRNPAQLQAAAKATPRAATSRRVRVAASNSDDGPEPDPPLTGRAAREELKRKIHVAREALVSRRRECRGYCCRELPIEEFRPHRHVCIGCETRERVSRRECSQVAA